MLETVVGILGAGFLAVIGWAIQVGNRVSVIETQVSGIDKEIEEKSKSIKELINARFDALDERQERTERFLNGSFRKYLEEYGHSH